MKEKRLLIVSFLIITGCLSVLCAQVEEKKSSLKVAVSFDDFPFVRVTSFSAAKLKEEIAKLIDAVTSQKVPAITFVNEQKLYLNNREDKRKVALLDQWVKAGLELGNHTFAHKSANEFPLNEFKDGIIKGEVITKQVLKDNGKTIKYFRFPELHTGLTLDDKTEIERFLKEKGYTIAPATIVCPEWVFAAAYEKAFDAKDEALMKKVGDAFIVYMKEVFDNCEKQTKFLFGRQINQILLLHANELSADYFPKLCEMLKQRGYEFISFDEALKDPAYNSPETYVGRDGISWLDRWAKSAGKDNRLFNGGPKVPEWITQMSNANSSSSGY